MRPFPFFFGVLALALQAPPQNELSFGDSVTASANLDAGYRRTQLFEQRHNTSVFQWDSRAEFWFPPSRRNFSWGPYARLAGIDASKKEAWENAWLAVPGVGVQLYPFSFAALRSPGNVAGQILGPVRLFAEYNVVRYWGEENSWRPKLQKRAGFEYWKAMNVNQTNHVWWLEVWNGAYWQSSNEFTNRYRTVVVANSVRVGFRKSNSKASIVTPYVVAESSHTKNDQYYWENRLLLGSGIRVAPPLDKRTTGSFLTRFVVFGEYVNTAKYYGVKAPSSTPRFDIRLGISASLGEWYK